MSSLIYSKPLWERLGVSIFGLRVSDFPLTTGTFNLQPLRTDCKTNSFFETDGLRVHHHHSQASGNPVRIGDGCATVTDYKLPLATVLLQMSSGGKAGARLRPKSGYRSGCARHGSRNRANFSAKRRMRPACSTSAEQDS
jgi:hypothetical protein